MTEDIYASLKLRMKELCQVISFKMNRPLTMSIQRQNMESVEQTFFNNWSSEEDRHPPSS